MRPSIDEIVERLRARFGSAPIDVQDDSHLHAGHDGAKGGGGHYTVKIVSDLFAGKPPLARHRSANAIRIYLKPQSRHLRSSWPGEIFP